jgi:L-threonylcarbamoyladenylate synthase
VKADDVAAFERCIAAGGVALFPADTIYGLAANPESEAAVRRLYEIKQRPRMPSAVMFFSLNAAFDALPELGARTRAAFERVLPGPLTLVVSNPEGRYRLACDSPPDRLGVRVPRLDGALEPLTEVARVVLQSSANRHGGADARSLGAVEPAVREAADFELDGGELPGVASTVVDLSGYEDGGAYTLLREGAVSEDELRRSLP